MPRLDPIWFPPSHDHPTHIWETPGGWMWSCPELKFGGGPHADVEAVQMFTHKYIQLAPNRGLVWVWEPPA